MSKGIDKINVRFFAYDTEGDEIGIVELTENEWREIEAPIEYERHSVFENGVRQICLTKRNI
jgi:hypothetical protein